VTWQDVEHPTDSERQAVREAAAPGSYRKNRLRRWVVRLTVIAGLGIVTLVVLLPTLLSTGPGTAWLLDRVNATIPGTITADDLTLGWLGNQQLEQARLTDNDGSFVASIGTLQLPDMPLWSLLWRSPDIGAMRVEQFRLDLVKNFGQPSNLQRALGLESDEDNAEVARISSNKSFNEFVITPVNDPPSQLAETPARTLKTLSLPYDLSVEATFKEVAISISGDGIQPTTLTMPEATLTVIDPSKMHLAFDADVQQQEASGRFEFAGTANDLFAADGQLTLTLADLDINARLSQLPLAPMDRLFAMKGKLHRLLGPILDGELQVTGRYPDFGGLMTLKSDHLNVSQKLETNGGSLHTDESSLAELTLTPEAWRAWAGENAGRLTQSVEIRLLVKSFDIPFTENAADFESAQLLTELRTDPWQIEVEDRGNIQITDVVASLSSEGLSKGFRLGLIGEIDAYGRPGSLVFDGSVQPTERDWKGLKVTAQINELPVVSIDELLNQGGRLEATFGEKVMMGLIAKRSSGGDYALTVDFGERGENASARLNGQMVGELTAEGFVSMRTKQPMTLLLTPRAAELWQRPLGRAADTPDGTVGLSLTDAMPISADGDFSVAMLDGRGLRFDPEQTGGTIRIGLPETELKDRWYDRTFRLTDGQIDIAAEDLREPVEIAVSFETDRYRQAEPGESAKTGRMTADARIESLMQSDGRIDWPEAQLYADIDIRNLPTVVFDALTRQQGYAVAAFGQELSSKLSLQRLSYAEGGRIDFDLNSENGSVGNLPGELDENWNLTLRAPSTFFLNATPQLSNRILRFVNPVILPAVVSARVPIVITLDDDSFNIPLRDFSWSLVNADAQVMMNTVTIVPNVSPVDKILPKLVQFNLIKDAELYEAEVAPIVLAIRQGVLSYEQLPISIDDVQLDFGGKIDILNRQVAMTLTIGGEAFEKDAALKQFGKIGIDIGGTIQEPTVKLDALNNLIGDVGTRLLREQTDRLLKDLFKKKPVTE
jgi:hypothetical protein